MSNNLSLYHVFNCVAETGNISQASKLLYVSQPAVSKAIVSLEEIMNLTLFIRNSRGVRLTEEGQLLYQYTKEAFEILKQGEERLKHMKELGVGHLKIGVSATLCKYVLLPIITVSKGISSYKDYNRASPRFIPSRLEITPSTSDLSQSPLTSDYTGPASE